MLRYHKTENVMFKIQAETYIYLCRVPVAFVRFKKKLCIHEFWKTKKIYFFF
jgi:hypothetical protein